MIFLEANRMAFTCVRKPQQENYKRTGLTSEEVKAFGISRSCSRCNVYASKARLVPPL